ncbi:putative oxidoreductase [Agrobacterium rubi TR3 = NBRC 13261]|uniref:Putative oxidoreductase n=1 Tax=Agrobacterium rubi TR3 = NBRC 13261 TaxID=1368415 RepID=A0A081D230_9HYPH|nr:GMC family oxidoreductase [Agrobacterium rubi]MBP1881003.1 choline dehydrogenase-like flavoprotein [Agrobacterium rubi]MCL6653756.1 dehydrogenase [Agrobacterium rubi]GAK72976.1 putative oxidoreductase [Agrobacterium rubi TR3 = NBRC 13261]
MNAIKDFYDVVIIGAGVGGGAMANRLAGRGRSILMIERGPRLPREPDNWSVDAVFHTRKYATKETWRDRDGKDFNPSTYYYVGGNSKFFGAATLRFRAEDFQDLQHEGGVAPAWPVSYDEFAPYYDIAEQLMGTHGAAGMDPTEPPRSGPMPYPAIGHEPEIAFFDKKLREKGLRPFPLPIAIDYHQGGSCIRCRTCDGFACQLGAKGDAEVRLVNPALAKGDVDLVTEAFVHRLLTDPTGKRVTGIEITHSGQTRTISADLFISSAGAINSSALLLRSANDAHKRGLGNNMSDQLGRNYMAHNNTAMMAISPFKKNRVTFQKSMAINDYYLANSEKPYPLGNVQGLGKLQGGMLTANARWAPEWLMAIFAERSVDWWLMSEDLPDPDNRVSLDADGKIRLSYTPNNLKSHNELVQVWSRCMRSLGYPLIITNKMDIKVSMHQCGTARFGNDPKTSVLDPHCKVWDVDNLYVVDASFLPSSTALNPSLTIVAQATRTADHILSQWGEVKMQPVTTSSAA